MVQAFAAWRAALDDELHLAAGVRRAARLDLKARIASRTTTMPAHATPWPRLLAAAAAVIILVSVGVYNDWFSRKSALPGEQITEHPAVPSDQTARSPEAGTSQGLPSGGPSKGHDEAPSARSSDQAMEARPPASTQEAKDIGTGKLEREASPKIGTRVYWAEGYLLSRTEAQGVAAAAEDRAQPTEETNLMQKSVVTSERKKGNAPATAVAEPPAMRFSVSQQQATAYEKSQMPGRSKHGAGTLPVLLEQRTDSLLITLYLDTLVDQAALQQATVSPITSDSLLVQCGRYVIGLQLPPPLQTLEEKRTRR
jgi:hypothetical protein